tara:strand:- start:872 stop:1390 length:519 start_codon:yes stop_codon:yes gene_type:complete
MDTYKKNTKDLENNFDKEIKKLKTHKSNYLLYPVSNTFKQKYDNTLENIDDIFYLQKKLIMELENKNEIIVSDLKNMNLLIKDYNFNNTNFKINKNVKNNKETSNELINNYKYRYNYEVLLLLGKFFSIIIVLLFLRNLMTNKNEKINMTKEIDDEVLDVKLPSKNNSKNKA